MAKPVPSGSPQTILVTSAIVKWKGVDIGLVSGVKIVLKHEVTEVKTDQLGKAIVNHFHVGDTVSAEMMMDEFTAVRLKTAYAKAAYLTSGGASKVSWGRLIGEDFYSVAGVLEIIPTSDDTTYFGRNFKMWKAAPVGDSSLEYGPDKKLNIKVTFFCYPDLTQAAGEFYGFFGDPAAGTLTPSSGGPAVAGGGNVGNGTISGIGTNDNFTVTETWTATCIHAVANGGIFAVSGSITGARGNATVGSSYASNSIVPSNSEITFTINDGATDFAVGDVFTIPTVAANYT